MNLKPKQSIAGAQSGTTPSVLLSSFSDNFSQASVDGIMTTSETNSNQSIFQINFFETTGNCSTILCAVQKKILLDSLRFITHYQVLQLCSAIWMNKWAIEAEVWNYVSSTLGQ